MDDRFLHDYNREPRPEFVNALRNGLGRADEDRAARPFRLVPALAGFAAVALIASLAFPSVRASAQAFLELFRVRQFTAIHFDPARLDKLKSLKNENNALVFDEKIVLREPGPDRAFVSVEEAMTATGLPLRRVTEPASGLALDTVRVEGEAEVKLTMHADRLRSLLDQLGLQDVSVPGGFDGQPIHVRKAIVTTQRYRSADGDKRMALIQARSPEVGLPPGADLARLGEVGLRVLGLDPAEARRIANSIDWRSTLVVPVPLNASTFRPVTIRGHDGLLVTCAGRGPDGERRREESIVMWSEGDQLLALATSLDGSTAVVMAESVR